MATYTSATMARYMRQLDICMMVTQSKLGILNSRPMSNNGDVKYNGSSYFFTYEGSKKGIDTKGMVLIHIKGDKLYYWQKDKGGTIKL